MDEAEIQQVNIPWHKVGCILKAVATFAVCETGNGQNCVETLVTDIRACLGTKAPTGKI